MDRMAAMETFVRVVDAGSFSGAPPQAGDRPRYVEGSGEEVAARCKRAAGDEEFEIINASDVLRAANSTIIRVLACTAAR